MSRPEVQFWDLIKKHVPGDVERIENLVSEGTPDVSGSWNGKDYWIELKVAKNKRKEIPPEKLCRQSQLVWHAKRVRQGAIIFLIVKYPNNIKLYKVVGVLKYRWKATFNYKVKEFTWNSIKEIIELQIRGYEQCQ